VRHAKQTRGELLQNPSMITLMMCSSFEKEIRADDDNDIVRREPIFRISKFSGRFHYPFDVRFVTESQRYIKYHKIIMPVTITGTVSA
jgi:hypothetical protein